ncbi:unnamed protein product [Rhizoctonia solani]|uniref:F-box domain-containing protein n=1 Tax=Rhizoctonia solani TaxID=456999 RepID=A0A8H3HSU1_9AGAM|nr:unnamed protein product [Rhizoctonia solani]
MNRPIDMIPGEIWIHIFQRLSTTHHCPDLPISAAAQSPYPCKIPAVVLSHVCSYWRSLVINARELWTHIDIDSDDFPEDRSEAYLARAGDIPLEVHISNRATSYNAYETVPGSEDSLCRWAGFLIDIAPRACSLIVQAFDSSALSQEFCRQAILIFIENCVPGRLKQLHIEIPRNPRDPDGHVIALPKVAEVLWHPVEVLRIYDFHPGWTSKLYYGLTELRLIHSSPVLESALVAVLKSNPKLRILQLYIRVNNVTPRNVPVVPVLLEDLEVLVPDVTPETGRTAFLRRIQPGSKQLALSIANWRTDFIGRDEVISFFARSNVSRLIVTRFRDYVELADLLSIAPTVREVALEDVIYSEIGDESVLFPPTTLDTLYLTRSPNASESTWPIMEWIVQRHRVRKLTLWRYGPCYDGETITLEEQYSACTSTSVTLLPDAYLDPVECWK